MSRGTRLVGSKRVRSQCALKMLPVDDDHGVFGYWGMGPQIGPRWTADGPQTDPKSNPDRPESASDRPQFDPSSTPDRPQTDPSSTPNRRRRLTRCSNQRRPGESADRLDRCSVGSCARASKALLEVTVCQVRSGDSRGMCGWVGLCVCVCMLDLRGTGKCVTSDAQSSFIAKFIQANSACGPCACMKETICSFGRRGRALQYRCCFGWTLNGSIERKRMLVRAWSPGSRSGQAIAGCLAA